ncbi:MAG TPA: MFS transporter [Acetobacteraceae bacterium]|jgi:MFS transporter, ACS family, tartrate transporter|nr:MFS transporter [Acetobacteraceae bacterium]
MYYEDNVIERSTITKLLWNLLPLLCLLAVGNVLDRLDLTYAAPTMDSVLRLTADQVRHANDAFDIGCLLAGLPAAAGILILGARRWIAAVVVAWGVITMVQGAAWSSGSLYVLRVLLGTAEVGLIPAMVFYLTEWMPPRYRSLPIAVIIAVASLVPVIGDQLANLALVVPPLLRITQWRWVFFAEGLPAVWLGLHMLGALPQTPPEANWLHHPERHWLLMQLREASRARGASRFNDGLRSAANWKLAAARLAVAAVAGSLGMWVPLAMQQTDYLSPGVGAVIMAVATVLGAVAAFVPGLPWNTRPWLRRALAIGLAVAGILLATAAILPSAMMAVLVLAFIAILLPPLLALTWVLAPYVLAGSAAAAGFAVLAMAGALGDLCASTLSVVRHDATTRCFILALLCLAAALLSLGMDRQLPADTRASAPAGSEQRRL